MQALYNPNPSHHRPRRRVTLPSLGEEIANAVTHGIGTLLSIAALVLFIIKAVHDSMVHGGGLGHTLCGYILFGLSLIFLYGMSTMYHALPRSPGKKKFQKLDHAAIYILIAGSYSAYCLSFLYSTVGLRIFYTVWALAIAGIVLQAVFGKRFRPYSLVMYLAMGWVMGAEFDAFIAAASPETFWLILAGGLSYTVGFIFYALQRFPWMHTIWHLFVLGGSVTHVLAILVG